MPTINLYGKISITGYIRTVTGLHIGKGKEGVMIGGVDNAVMRDVLTNTPYIPGSSLKGKLRSLAEKSDPQRQPNTSVGKKIFIHGCNSENCPICRLYGIAGQDHDRSGGEVRTAPTRLIVRDVMIETKSREDLARAETDLPYTEVKYETSIDRVTSQANPRPLERVPANVLFGPFEMILSLYQPKDFELLAHLFKTMRLLEDDYLGGSGSRGSGKIKFESLSVEVRSISTYGSQSATPEFKTEAEDIAALINLSQQIADEVKKILPQGGTQR